MEYLQWLSNTPFPAWVRESETVWAYPSVLFLHSLGMALLVGFIFVLDLRILGVGPKVSIAPMGRLLRLVWAGFWINAVSGVLLVIIAPDKLENPVFWVKLALIGLGMICLALVQREFSAPAIENQRFSSRGRVLGAISLFVWCGAITAGRLMAYIGGTK